MFLVLGLGNPGPRYVGTRHNAGFLVVDTLARREQTAVDKEQHGALTAKVRLAGESAVLAKPQSFMNLSGGPARRLVDFYKVEPDHVIVVHDELDVPFGDVKLKVGGGHGGHNGLRDLHKHLGGDYLRVRVGVSRPPPGWDTAKYVLGSWSDAESASLSEVVDTAADAVEAIVRDGIRSAMNHFHAPPGSASAASSG